MTTRPDYDRFLSRATGSMQESAIRKMGALGLRTRDLISLAAGFPAPDTFAWDAFREIAESLLDGSDGSVLQYGATRGYRPLVEALPQILAERGIRAAADDILVTNGSQQGLDLCARAFVDPGDVVLVELFLSAGADRDVLTDDGRSAADLAAAAGHTDLATRLRE